MKRSAILVALATFSVAFAGCTSSGDSTDPSQTDGEGGAPVELGTKGAINGLVVDDNFRPVQLKESWGNGGPGEFQDLGFVLIMETGQRFETNENGEFQARPLEPGTYTVRVAADNHEAKDTTVNVVSGEFTEVTLEARRQNSDGGTILSQEQVLFIACAANAVAVNAATLPGGCGDTSGDSERFDFWTDYTSIKEDVRGIVTEMRASGDGYYGILIRHFESGCSSSSLGDCIFAEPEVANGAYIHQVLYPGKQFEAKGEYLEEGEDGYCAPRVDGCRIVAFELEYPFQTALFPEAASRQYTDQVYDAIGVGLFGAGLILGTKAQFVQTAFLYEMPEDGIEDYCVLCEDAQIPE